MKWTQTEKRQLAIFFAVAFGVPCLMGVAMALVHSMGGSTSVFASTQMFYPAAGAMLALLITRRGDKLLPRRFYIGFLALTAVMAVIALTTFMQPGLALMLSNYAIILGSVVCLVLYFVDGKARRTAGGLRLGGAGGGRAIVLTVLLFLALYLGRYAILIAASKLADPSATLADMGFTTDWLYLGINLAVLPLNFFLVYTPFLGEEYGWRAFLQPLLQKRFGPRRGVLALGVLWGVWHLPLNIFFYSPSTWLQSLVNQIVLCVCLAAFFGYAQHKTRTVWVPVVLHYLNNNLIAVFAGTTSVIENQVIGWADVAVGAVLLAALYLPSLASRFWKEPLPCLPLDIPAEPAAPAAPSDVPAGDKQPPQYGPLN